MLPPEGFQNVAFTLFNVDDAKLVNCDMPPSPGPKELTIRSMCTGICGTDIHYLKEMALGEIKITKPMVLGHEASGQVVAVGSEVKNFKPGDRVCYDPNVPCMECEYCQRMEWNLCVMSRVMCPPFTGTLTYYFNHPAQFTHKLPDNVTAEEGAMIEPLSCAVYAAQRGYLTVGDRLLILGSGPIGLLVSMVAKVYGCTRIVVADIREERLKLAQELGVDDTILVDRSWKEDRYLEEIRKRFDGDQPNKVFECTGVASNFRMALLAAKNDGLAMMVGMGPTEVMLPIADSNNREVTIRSIFRCRGTFPLSIELVATGKVQPTKLISHRFDLKDCSKAFEVAANGEGVKVMIKVGDDSI